MKAHTRNLHSTCTPPAPILHSARSGARPGYEPANIPSKIKDSNALALVCLDPSGPGWTDEHGLASFDGHSKTPEGPHTYRQSIIEVNPADFLLWQYRIAKRKRLHYPSYDEWINLAVDPANVESIKRGIADPNGRVPMPVILVKDGQIDYNEGLQEGRHRALACEHHRLPILVIERIP